MTKRKTGTSRTPSHPKRTDASTSGRAADATGRYTPPAPTYRLRPGWHRIAGWLGVILGIVIAVVNDVMLVGDDLRLLPFGHSELYLFLGVAVAGGSTWFLGLFDRETTVYR